MNIYYVYAYLNQTTGKPYYIGKGKENRINAPHQNLNIPPDPKNRILLKENLSEQEALIIETEYIEKYGRKDLGTGILQNRTNGGVGGDTSRYRDYKPLSDETKNKFRETKKKNNKPVWNKGKKGVTPGNKMPRDAEYRQKISETLRGYGQGIPKRKLECPHCGKVGGEPGMKRWHFDNCKTVFDDDDGNQYAKDLARMRRG